MVSVTGVFAVYLDTLLCRLRLFLSPPTSAAEGGLIQGTVFGQLVISKDLPHSISSLNLMIPFTMSGLMIISSPAGFSVHHAA